MRSFCFSGFRMKYFAFLIWIFSVKNLFKSTWKEMSWFYVLAWRKIKSLLSRWISFFFPSPLIWHTKNLSFTLIPLILLWFYFLNPFPFSQYLHIQCWNYNHCSNTVIPSNYVCLFPHEKWPLRHLKVNCAPLSFIMYLLSHCQFGGEIKNRNRSPKS